MKRVLTVVAIMTLATGCSSGGGGTSSVPAQQTSPTQAAPQAIGTGTLTIKFPTSFGHAVATAKTKLKTPAYVNPTTGDYLDVYVNAQLVLLPSSGLSYDTVAIANNPTGLQTVSIPIYSGTSDVMVAERDTDTNPGSPVFQPGDLLALGQATQTGIGPGSSVGISVSMGMNLNTFAYSTNGTNAFVLSNGCNALGLVNQTSSISIFPADITGGYTGLAGIGGVPTVTASANAIANSSNFLTSPLGAYALSYDAGGDTISNVNVVSSTNPAYNVYYNQLSSADQIALPLYNNPAYTTGNLNWNISFSPTNGFDCGF